MWDQGLASVLSTLGWLEFHGLLALYKSGSALGSGDIWDTGQGQSTALLILGCDIQVWHILLGNGKVVCGTISLLV
jgi:hypothetical protein